VAFDLYSFPLFNNPYEGENLLNSRGVCDIFLSLRELAEGQTKQSA
jgi:hypothetical protein